MSQLANQIAVVTGAGRGIGRAIALKFAAEGADIVCVSRTSENSEKVAGEIRALGRRAWAWAVDVADSKAVAEAGEKIVAQAGRVDVLVNNAGVTRDGLLMRMSEEDWDTVLDTNLKGAFLFTRAFARTFLKQRSGRIINVASVLGLIGNAGQCNYASSKAALIGFTKSVARELASRGIRRYRRGNAEGIVAENSVELFWPAGGHCARGVVSGRSGGPLYHRPGAHRGRRPGDVNSDWTAVSRADREHKNELKIRFFKRADSQIQAKDFCHSGLDALRNVA